MAVAELPITVADVIVAAGFCPQPPALVPAVGGAAAQELSAVREAAAAVVTRLRDTGAQLLLLGAGDSSMVHGPLARGSFACLGVPYEVHLGNPGCGGSVELALSLSVGAWLVGEVAGTRTNAIAVSIGPDFSSSRAAADLLGLVSSQDVAVLALGDGSASRAVGAPGRRDDAAERFDAALAAALRSGDPLALAALDAADAEAVRAAGLPVWHAVADLVTEPALAAELSYCDSPFEVTYPVAYWRCA